MPPERATCWERCFAPMGEGSLRGSIFTLMASSIGAGVLTLPYVFKMIGFGAGIIMITLGMIGNIWSCRTLCECALAAKSKKYLQTCRVLGGKTIAFIYQIVIITLQFGCVLGFQIISILAYLNTIGADMISQIIVGFGFQRPQTLQYRVMIVLIPALFLNFPLSMIPRMTSLRYPAMFGIFSIFFTILVVFAQGVYSIYLGNLLKVKLFKFEWSFFQSIGITFYAFTCQQCLFPILDDLAYPTKKRINTVLTLNNS
jgi:amino acid permease